MKLSLLLITLLMLPLHTEAKAKLVDRAPSSDGTSCGIVTNVGMSYGTSFAQMRDNSTLKDLTITINAGSRDRYVAMIAAANASLSSNGKVFFCVENKSKAEVFSLDGNFTASIHSEIKN